MDKVNIPGLSPYYGLATGFSRSFQNLIRDIGDARSKYEEDRIIQREVQYLKDNIDKPNVDSKQMKENLIRLIYCEMLGHDASFGFIHAINFTQKGKLMEKRIGYLACCLLLREDHELTLLLMNALQKDLKSSNIMANCIALIAASRLVSKDTIPTVLPLVVDLLQHKREMVRKKAVMVLLRFHHLDPSSVSSLKSRFESTLCDRNPGVMGTTLNVYLTFVSESPDEFKRLVGPFVNILKQVIEFRLPSEFTYYNVPAPWIQIKLFKILAHLGRDDQQQSEKMYEILKQCIDTAYIENNIGCAVLSECLYTAATIHPNKQLSEATARRVGLLLVSRNNNLKYLGIKILAHLIKTDVSYAFRHQMTVIDCLNDPDETLKRKTLVLLYRITNSSNVSVICDKLIHYLRSSVDEHLRADLVDKITTLAEKYAPDNDWFIETMNNVFELGGSLVQPQVAHNIMRLIGEGSDDDELDTDLRLYAVNSYLDLIEKPSLPDILIHLICWVIGEYSYLATHFEPEAVMDKLCSLFHRQFHDKCTKSWIVTAITKIAGQLGYLPNEVRQVIQREMQKSMDVELNQRCADLLAVFNVFDSFAEVLPIDASCEDLEVFSL
eukprot:gene9386-10375_t